MTLKLLKIKKLRIKNDVNFITAAAKIVFFLNFKGSRYKLCLKPGRALTEDCESCGQNRTVTFSSMKLKNSIVNNYINNENLLIKFVY